MKTGVLIALILCGTLLLLGPVIIENVRDPGEYILSDSGRTTLFLAGGLMILSAIIVAVIGAARHPRLKA